MSGQQIYHLLSSAARRQYSEDILRVLALPRGARLQFRYTEDLLTQSARDDIKNKNLQGAECLISFLHASKEGVEPLIVPCRKGRIVEAGFFGAFVVIVFSVEEFVFSEDPKQFTEKLRKNIKLIAEDANDHVPKWVQVGTEDKLRGRWVLPAHEFESHLVKDYEFSTFTKTTDTLSSLFPFNEEEGANLNPFFHISIFDQSELSSVRSFSHADLQYSLVADAGTFELSPAHDYVIRVHHYFPQPSKYVREYSRKLVVSLDDLAPRYNDKIEMKLTSEYDVKEVSFRTLSSFFAQHKTISVSLADVTDKPQDEVFAEVQLPVSTKPAIIAGIGQAAFVGVGIAMPAIIGASFRPEFGFWSAIAMIAGGFIVGLAAVFGLKRTI